MKVLRRGSEVVDVLNEPPERQAIRLLRSGDVRGGVMADAMGGEHLTKARNATRPKQQLLPSFPPGISGPRELLYIKTSTGSRTR